MLPTRDGEEAPNGAIATAPGATTTLPARTADETPPSATVYEVSVVAGVVRASEAMPAGCAMYVARTVAGRDALREVPPESATVAVPGTTLLPPARAAEGAPERAAAYVARTSLGRVALRDGEPTGAIV